jgi:hypothetical protein
MKQICVLLILFISTKLNAQFSDAPGEIKLGGGYTHDFPGLNGYTVAGEYLFWLAPQWQGGIGAKYADMQGYPRTAGVQEYTRAKSIDFNVYWVPLRDEQQLFRIGLGYSFSFFDIKRASPLYVIDGGKTTVTWPAQQETGRTTGINLIAEYAYTFPGSNVSLGIRGALYKAYTRTYFIGPMIGFGL